jgi:hypothetical protein
MQRIFSYTQNICKLFAYVNVESRKETLILIAGFGEVK